MKCSKEKKSWEVSVTCDCMELLVGSCESKGVRLYLLIFTSSVTI